MIFSGVKSITIPEGKVKKITAGGVVLWEAVMGRIPSEYQEVEYVANTAISSEKGSYIDLGFAFDAACTFYLHFVPPSSSADYIFGAAENSGKLRCMITDQTKNTLLYGSTGSGYISVGTAKYNGEKSLKCELKQGLLKITDLINNTSAQDTRQTNYTMTNNLYLFAQNYNGSARMANIATKIKSFSYYDKTDTLICDLVPCYRKSDGVIGMYDIVRRIFLTNVGSGSFKKGADV